MTYYGIETRDASLSDTAIGQDPTTRVPVLSSVLQISALKDGMVLASAARVPHGQDSLSAAIPGLLHSIPAAGGVLLDLSELDYRGDSAVVIGEIITLHQKAKEKPFAVVLPEDAHLREIMMTMRLLDSSKPVHIPVFSSAKEAWTSFGLDPKPVDQEKTFAIRAELIAYLAQVLALRKDRKEESSLPRPTWQNNIFEEIYRDGETLIIVLAPNIQYSSEAGSAISMKLKELTSRPEPPHITIDLGYNPDKPQSGSNLDKGVLGVLWGTHNALSAKGVSLTLRNIPPATRERLRILRMDTHFRIEE